MDPVVVSSVTASSGYRASETGMSLMSSVLKMSSCTLSKLEIGMIASQSRSSLTACSCSATPGRDDASILVTIAQVQREVLQHLNVEENYRSSAEDHTGDAAEPAKDDHGQHADGLQEGECLRADEGTVGCV